MHIDLTEEDFKNFVRCSTPSQVTNFLMEEGLTLRSEPVIPDGVYRRVNGQDLIEYTKYSGWVPFSHWLVNSEISWTMGRDDIGEWVMVLDANYNPVVDGAKVVFNRDGKVLKVTK